MTEYQHVCRSCGSEFVSKRKIRKTCSVSCRGRVGGQGQIKGTKEEKFLNQIKLGNPDECWPWPGKRNSFNYGIFNYRLESTRAHRLSYEIFVGEIPPGQIIRHKCDNPPCVNPSHLETGTRSDNIQDMLKRGRHQSQTRTECSNGHDLTIPGSVKATSRESICVKCARDRSRRWAAKTRAALRTK